MPKIFLSVIRNMEDEESWSLGTVNDDEFTEFDHDVSEPPAR